MFPYSQGVYKLMNSYIFSSGSHTGLNIAHKFQNVVAEFKIVNKFKYVVTDNAANMKRAFTISLEEESGVRDDALDDESIWEDLPIVDDEVQEILRSTVTTRLSCFAHSLQLTVGDGIKVSKQKYYWSMCVVPVSEVLFVSA